MKKILFLIIILGLLSFSGFRPVEGLSEGLNPTRGMPNFTYPFGENITSY